MAIPNGQINAGDIITTNIRRKHFIRRNYDIRELVTLAEMHSRSSSAYGVLYDYYKGNHIAIQSRTFDDANKPNSKIVHNFPKLLVDTSTAYLAGEPITESGDEKTIKAMQPVMKENYVTDVNSEEIKLSGIFGHCFEIHWIDRNNKHRFKAVSPMNCLIAYSADLDEEPLAAIYYNTVISDITGHVIRTYEIYTEDKILKFSTDDEIDVYKEIPEVLDIRGYEEHPNLLKKFPVLEIIANEERLGDFEAQLSLIDAYNLAVSDSVNDIAYWNDAYLWLQGFDLSADSDSISNMKNDRVIVTDDTGNVKFITKDVNDKHIENIKNRAKLDIFSLSQTPDLVSKDFTAASGQALKAATQPLENKSAVKESKFRKVLAKRYELICSYLELMSKEKDLKPNEVTPVFVRNLPQSYAELADMAVKLRDMLPDETIINQFPWITDARQEVEKADAQRQKRADIALQNFKQTSAVQGASTAAANKLDKNPANTSTITTTDPVAAKEQEKAIQKKPKTD